MELLFACIKKTAQNISSPISMSSIRELKWMEIHREELEANWTLLTKGEQFFRIDPLK